MVKSHSVPILDSSGYTQPICVIAEGVLLAAHRTEFRVSWPDLGLCPSSVGGHFFCSVLLLSCLLRTAQLFAVVLEPSPVSAIMKFTPRVFFTFAWGQDNSTRSWSNDATCT